MVLAYSLCSVSRLVPSMIPDIPIMPFIGVRISWLMFARNSLLARVAASAVSLASYSSSSACLRAVMSRMKALKMNMSSDRIGEIANSTGNSCSSRWPAVVSTSLFNITPGACKSWGRRWHGIFYPVNFLVSPKTPERSYLKMPCMIDNIQCHDEKLQHLVKCH